MSARESLADVAQRVEQALQELLPAGDVEPRRLHEAMRYSTLGGGKRVRPALVVFAGEACGSAVDRLLAPAAAMEMIHCFSLIHDDLPALDDDDLRRGRPSLHRATDEATAILAGDALLNLALEILARRPEDLDAARRLGNVLIATESVGTFGMIGGQMADLEGSHVPVERAAEALESIHARKTGALLAASLRIGANTAGANESLLQRMHALGHHIGLIFQIRDDILDIEGDVETLGKTPGKDVDASKLTYPALYGLDGSRMRMVEQAERARALLGELPDNSGRSALLDLVAFLVERDH